MKNPEIEKKKFPFIIDVRDYITPSTIIKKEEFKSNEKGIDLSVDDNSKDSEKAGTFDLFSHILEG